MGDNLPRNRIERLLGLDMVTTPAELAKQLGCSERSLRALARRLGACRVIGKSMVLLPEDVRIIRLADVGQARPEAWPSKIVVRRQRSA